MKKKILLSLLIVISLFLVVGCNNKETNKKNNNDLGENEYSLYIGKTIEVEGMTITLENVADSRCPKDVECYWEGELEYNLTINESSFKISTVLNPKIELNNYTLSIINKYCNETSLAFKLEKRY